MSQIRAEDTPTGKVPCPWRPPRPFPDYAGCIILRSTTDTRQGAWHGRSAHAEGVRRRRLRKPPASIRWAATAPSRSASCMWRRTAPWRTRRETLIRVQRDLGGQQPAPHPRRRSDGCADFAGIAAELRDWLDGYVFVAHNAALRFPVPERRVQPARVCDAGGPHDVDLHAAAEQPVPGLAQSGRLLPRAGHPQRRRAQRTGRRGMRPRCCSAVSCTASPTGRAGGPRCERRPSSNGRGSRSGPARGCPGRAMPRADLRPRS